MTRRVKYQRVCFAGNTHDTRHLCLNYRNESPTCTCCSQWWGEVNCSACLKLKEAHLGKARGYEKGWAKRRKNEQKFGDGAR